MGVWDRERQWKFGREKERGWDIWKLIPNSIYLVLHIACFFAKYPIWSYFFVFLCFFNICFRREINISKNTYLPLFITEMGYGRQIKVIFQGQSVKFWTTVGKVKRGLITRLFPRNIGIALNQFSSNTNGIKILILKFVSLVTCGEAIKHPATLVRR